VQRTIGVLCANGAHRTLRPHVSRYCGIFIAHADVATNTVAAVHRRITPARLRGVVAHEIKHNLIRNRLGVLRGVMLPAWVASSFPESEGLRLLASGPHGSIIVVPVFRRIAKSSGI